MLLITSFLYEQSSFGFLAASLIFFLTIFLVAKRWIGFGITFLFLIFAIATGLVISSYHSLQVYLTSNQQSKLLTEHEFTQIQQLEQTVQDLKNEIVLNKENIDRAFLQIETLNEKIQTQSEKQNPFKTDSQQPISDLD